MRLTINDKSISPMVVKVRQYSNTDVIEYAIGDYKDNLDLSEYYPYFICDGKSYSMSKSVESNALVISLNVKGELTAKAETGIYQIVFKDSEGKIWWYSSKGIFIVADSVQVQDFGAGSDDSADNDGGINGGNTDGNADNYGRFNINMNYILGIPNIYEEG